MLLFIHATPLRHRQTLQVLAHNEPFVSASVSTYNVAICFISITMLYHASGEHPSPCGLYDSLCTLRVGRSTIRLSFPVTQHSVRVVGYSFPDRDSHPARNTRLCLAHTLLPSEFMADIRFPRGIIVTGERAQLHYDLFAISRRKKRGHPFSFLLGGLEISCWICGMSINK